MTNFASLTVTVTRVIDMNIHSERDQKFDRDKKRMGEQNYFKSRYYFFFRKVKVKNWLTISSLLKIIFLNLIMSKNFITS